MRIKALSLLYGNCTRGCEDIHLEKGSIMNWDQVEGKWRQMTGSIKQQWGKLTDDDLDYINGKRDEFLGRLQQRYGIAREEAQKQLDRWMSEQKAVESERAAT